MIPTATKVLEIGHDYLFRKKHSLTNMEDLSVAVPDAFCLPGNNDIRNDSWQISHS